MGNKIRDAIQSFWKGKLTKVEVKELLDGLDGQAEALSDELKGEFAKESDGHKHLSVEESDRLLEGILQKAGTPTPVRKLFPYRWVGAAAVAIILAAVGLLYQSPSTDLQHTYSLQSELLEEQTYSIIAKEDSIRYVMSDGSTVLLAPNSQIRYGEGYGERHRNIVLLGEGQFSVRRDSLLPFMVEANGFTTTALGTEFIVDGRRLDRTTVQLISGKVVIRSMEEAGMHIEDTYLLAGERFEIDEILQTAVLHTSPESKLGIGPHLKDSKLANTHRINKTGAYLRFEKQDLREVVRQIAVTFGKNIIIQPEVPENLTFTGEFAPDEDLETILETICLVNDLQYERDASHLYIRAGSTQYPIADPAQSTSSDNN